MDDNEILEMPYIEPLQFYQKSNYIKKGKKFNIFLEKFDYPFSHCNDEYFEKYNISIMFCPLIGQKETVQDCGLFPNNIKYFNWYKEGKNDWKPWLLLCQLDNDKYAYFRASCDYTGFDCQGGMDLYISESKDTLIQMAMNEEDRKEYNKFMKKQKNNKNKIYKNI